MVCFDKKFYLFFFKHLFRPISDRFKACFGLFQSKSDQFGACFGFRTESDCIGLNQTILSRIENRKKKKKTKKKSSQTCMQLRRWPHGASKQYSTKMQLLPIFIFFILVTTQVSRDVDSKNENIIRSTITVDKSSNSGPGVFQTNDTQKSVG